MDGYILLVEAADILGKRATAVKVLAERKILHTKVENVQGKRVECFLRDEVVRLAQKFAEAPAKRGGASLRFAAGCCTRCGIRLMSRGEMETKAKGLLTGSGLEECAGRDEAWFVRRFVQAGAVAHGAKSGLCVVCGERKEGKGK